MLRAVLAGLCVTVAATGCGGDGTGSDADAGPSAVDAGLRCEPTAGGPYWIEEGDPLVAQVVCQTGLPLAAGDVALSGLPAGATFDPDTAELRFSPGLDQAAVYHLTIDVARLAETADLQIGVADRFDDPDNTPVVDASAYPEEFGLPVIFVSPRPTDNQNYQPVTVTYRGRSYQIQGKLRGKSSLSYPKQSYTLDFSGDKLDDPAVGFLGKKKIVLTTTFDDNSYLRVRLAWALWNLLSPTVPVGSFSAVVYLDGDYYGLYTVSDHIDDELMASAGLPDDVNLYKAESHDANFRLTRKNGTAKATLHDGYLKKHGLPDDGQPGAYDDLDALVDFVATSDDFLFASQIGDRVDVADYVAWWLLVTFLQADDSAGKNSYHAHDGTIPWHVVPWDFNNSLGQSWFTTREDASPVLQYFGNNRLFERLRADSIYGADMTGRFAAELRGGAFDRAGVAALIEAMAAELATSAHRDERRWRDDYLAFSRWSFRTDFTTFDEEVSYLRDWTDLHWQAMASQFPE